MAKDTSRALALRSRISLACRDGASVTAIAADLVNTPAPCRGTCPDLASLRLVLDDVRDRLDLIPGLRAPPPTPGGSFTSRGPECKSSRCQCLAEVGIHPLAID